MGSEGLGNQHASPHTIWKTVTRFATVKIAPWMALQNALGVALPLALGATAERRAHHECRRLERQQRT